MRGLAVDRTLGLLFAVAVGACGPGVVEPPSSLATDARYLTFHPERVALCDRAGSMPGRGRVPEVAREGAEGTILLEVPGATLEPYYATEDEIPVLRLPETGFTDGLDAVELPAPQRAWRVVDGAFVRLDLAATPRPRLGVQLASACAERLAGRCASGDLDEARCSTFDETVDVYIPEALDQGLGAVAPLGEGRAMAVRRPKRSIPRATFFDLDARTSRASEIAGLAPEDVAHLAAYQRRLGEELWLFGPSGALARGNLSNGFSVIRAAEVQALAPTEGARRAWMDGPHDDSPFELFVLDGLGAFARYDGRELLPLDPGAGEALERGDVVWLRPGEAIAIGSRRSEIVRVVDGVVRLEALARGDDRPTAAAHVPGIGTVVGTARGLLYVDAGAGWTPLPSPDDGLAVHGIAPLGRGFVFGRSQENGTGGRIVEYLPGVGLCPSVRVTTQNVQRLFSTEDGLLVYSKDSPTHAFVGFVRTRSRYPSCDR